MLYGGKKKMQLATKNEGKTERELWILLIGIVLIGANLRAPLTSVGSLIPVIRDDLGVSNALVGTITTIPLLAFAFISPFVPKIANRFGMERTIFVSMLILLVGIILRSTTGVVTLFSGTMLIGIGIAFGNVLIPGLIKMSFPLKIGLITGFYAVSMNLFGALASGLSIPISSIGNVGWQGALGAWFFLVLIAIVIWLPQLKVKADLPKFDTTKTVKKTNMWKSKTAWQVTVFMGLQSLMFYTILTWLPELLQLNGYSLGKAGWMLSIMQFAVIPMTFIVPLLAGKLPNQKIISIFVGSLFILGVLGLIQGHATIIVIAVIFIGIACGSAFSLSMMFFTLRTKDGYEASELSGMAQSIGYLLAATGPILFGGLSDLTNSWSIPLFMLLLVSFVILIAGILAARDVIID